MATIASPLVTKPKVLADPFAPILEYLDDAATHVTEVYELDKAQAFADAKSAQAAKLAKSQLAKAASLLRDLTYTAWMESSQPMPPLERNAKQNPISPSNPRYNPATGTAPPSK